MPPENGCESYYSIIIEKVKRKFPF